MLDQWCYHVLIHLSVVQRITGITEEMLRDEEPLSTVLPKFLAWVSTTTEEVSKQTKRRHHPGTTEVNADWQRLSTCTIVSSPQYSTGSSQWVCIRLSTALSWDGTNTRTWPIYMHSMQYPLLWHTNLHETGKQDEDDKFQVYFEYIMLSCLGKEKWQWIFPRSEAWIEEFL